MKILFSSQKLAILVLENEYGETETQGSYKYAKINSAIPLSCGIKCILLIDSDDKNINQNEKLFCLSSSGDVIWNAKLPCFPDHFLNISENDSYIIASTWSGYKIFIDKITGKEEMRIFTK